MSTATAVMTIQEVAHRLVELCRAGKNPDAIKELYASNVVSIEPAGGTGPERTEGFDNVLNKTLGWLSNVEEFHGAVIGDPIVAGNHFAVSEKVDVTMKGMGRFTMDEIAVFEVTNGKITKDRFFYNTKK
ncbi:MAG: nuclear transport factor 2 family protein [Flavobacteriales bacterium]